MEVQPCQSHRDRRSTCFGNSAVTETRKLAAIMVSDVVGYSRLTGADEDRILARRRAFRSDLIDPSIAVHHGRVVERTGDGKIVEFRGVEPRPTGSMARLCFARCSPTSAANRGSAQWFGRRRLKMKTAAGYAVSVRC
jgi:class 3 adenylate cyclase